VVETLFDRTGIDLSSRAGIPELVKFQEYCREYKIVVYHGLKCEDIMFEGQVYSAEQTNLLYDGVELHYHVITNLTVDMARKYVCKACNKTWTLDVTQSATRRAATTCPVLRAISPMFAECYRHFRRRTCFADHKQYTTKKKSVCERKRCCAKCGWIVTHENR
jgi:hypothetical protein